MGGFFVVDAGRDFFLLRVRGCVVFFSADAGARFFLLRVRGRVFFYCGCRGGTLFFVTDAERFCYLSIFYYEILYLF